MENLLLTLSPFLVAAISKWVKPPKHVHLVGYRKIVIRFGVAVLSFGAVIGSAFLSGQEIDVISVTTFSEAILTFLGATGTYFLVKKSL